MSIYFKRKKDPHEKLVLTFDFTGELATGETLTGTPTVTYATVEGIDASPSALNNGTGAINAGAITPLVGPVIAIGKAFQQPVQGGLSGCVYSIEVVAATSNSNKVLALTGLLRVEEGA
jgi:hypothetical protein